LEHISWEDNKRADILSKLSVTKKKSHQRSVIQIWLRHPSVTEAEAEADNWMTPVLQYLTAGTCKADQEKAMKQQCARYTMINEDLYWRGYSTPLLKCITNKRAEYILAKIHEGICGNHARARTIAAKVLRAGYYWPTIQSDCAEYVKKYAKCQVFDPLHHTRLEELQNIISPWPFAIWGMNIISPFSPGKGRPSSSWWESTTSPNESRSNPPPPSRQKMCKTSYGGALSADLASRTR